MRNSKELFLTSLIEGCLFMLLGLLAPLLSAQSVEGDLRERRVAPPSASRASTIGDSPLEKKDFATPESLNTEQIHLLEQKMEQQKKLWWAALGIFALALPLIYVFFHRQQHLLQLSKDELNTTQNELAGMAQNLHEHSAVIENLRLKIEKSAHAHQHGEYLEQLTSNTILTEDDWQQFRKTFQKTHPGFLEAQKTLHPNLTSAELRYVALEKLNLNSGEMANILGVSDSAVRKTRSRAKKKMQA